MTDQVVLSQTELAPDDLSGKEFNRAIPVGVSLSMIMTAGRESAPSIMPL